MTTQPIDIAYQLPTTLQSIQSGWIASSQTAATVSALIAAGDSQLLSFMKDIDIADPTEPFASHPAAHSVMLGFLYTGLFLSISATVTPLIITEMFSELPLSAARRRANAKVRDSLHSVGSISASVPGLLRRYGMRDGLRSVQWHWFFCFTFGIILSVLSVWIYVIIEESLAMKILISFVVAFSLWPCFNFYVKTDITLPGVDPEKYPIGDAAV